MAPRTLILAASAALAPACGGSPASAGPDAAAPDAAADAASVGCDIPAVTIAHGAGSPAAARIHKLDLGAHPEAVCNDGSPGYFIYRPGFGPAAKRWMIHLQGGGSCSSAAECAARQVDSPDLMTSTDVTDGAVFTTKLAGFKSASPTENPDFHDASFVQIHYCSSDQWGGDLPAVAGAPTTEMAHWHFRGRAIAAAAVAELMPLGLGAADEVLLTGSSAGGMGVANNADDLRGALPARIRVVASPDAGYGLFYPPYDAATGLESTMTPSQLELDFIAGSRAWGGRGDRDCDLAALDDTSHARCRVPDQTFQAGQVTTRVFVRQSQQDSVQIKQHGAGPGSPGPVQAYRDRFAARMRNQLAALSDRFSVFSTNDSLHVVMDTTAAWTTMAVGGVVLRDAFGAWYRDPCAGGAKRIAP